MNDGWPFPWGVQLPTIDPGLSFWPVAAVLVLLLMINVAANKALPSYYLFWTLGGSLIVLVIAILDGATWGELGLSPSTWLAGFIWGMISILVIFTIYAVGSTWRKARTPSTTRTLRGSACPDCSGTPWWNCPSAR